MVQNTYFIVGEFIYIITEDGDYDYDFNGNVRLTNAHMHRLSNKEYSLVGHKLKDAINVTIIGPHTKLIF